MFGFQDVHTIADDEDGANTLHIIRVRDGCAEVFVWS